MSRVFQAPNQDEGIGSRWPTPPNPSKTCSFFALNWASPPSGCKEGVQRQKNHFWLSKFFRTPQGSWASAVFFPDGGRIFRKFYDLYGCIFVMPTQLCPYMSTLWTSFLVMKKHKNRSFFARAYHKKTSFSMFRAQARENLDILR